MTFWIVVEYNIVNLPTDNSYQLNFNNIDVKLKLIGTYSSLELAERAVNGYKNRKILSN